jgi:hypothetical protein
MLAWLLQRRRLDWPLFSTAPGQLICSFIFSNVFIEPFLVSMSDQKNMVIMLQKKGQKSFNFHFEIL